ENLRVVRVIKPPINVRCTAAVPKEHLLPGSDRNAIKVLSSRRFQVTRASKGHSVCHIRSNRKIEYVVWSIENRRTVIPHSAAIICPKNMKLVRTGAGKSHPLRRKSIQPVTEKLLIIHVVQAPINIRVRAQVPEIDLLAGAYRHGVNVMLTRN